MSLVIDVLIPILQLDNQNGIYLKRYSIHCLVCKVWKLAASDTIKILNLNKLVKVSKYRKISLLAKILNEDVLIKFKNMTKLIINLPDLITEWSDFYKIYSHKDYDLYNCGRKEMINDYVQNGYKKTLISYNDIYNGNYISNFVSTLASDLWYSAVSKTFNMFTDDPGKAKSYMEVIMIEELIQLKQLKTLIIKKGNIDINKVLLSLPKLKELFLTANYPTALAINIEKSHDLETFILLRPFENLDFLEKLPKLKKLIVINPNPHDTNYIISLCKLKELESLTISTMILPIEAILSCCKNLNHLGLIDYVLRTVDLEVLVNSNIKSVDLIEKYDDLLFTDWRSGRSQDAYKMVMREFRHTKKDIGDFMVLRPDISIKYKNNILTKTMVDRSIYYF